MRIISTLHPLLLVLNPTLSSPHPPHPKPPKNGGLTGDQLNFTQCVCRSEANDRWGFYIQIDYYNYHNNRHYKTSGICHNGMTRSMIPDCWNHDIMSGVTLKCDVDEEENRFCYHRSDIAKWDEYVRNDRDHFTFNSQRRKLDENHPTHNPDPIECDTICPSVMMSAFEYTGSGQDGKDAGYTSAPSESSSVALKDWKPMIAPRYVNEWGAPGYTGGYGAKWDYGIGWRTYVYSFRHVHDDLDDMCWDCA